MNNQPISKTLKILRHEAKHWNVPVVEFMKVQGADPFRILVATILSARTKDETTAPAAARLFEKVKGFDDLEKISQKEIEKLIFPVGFYRNKAAFLKELPGVVTEKFGGKIPHEIEELIQLPGVGRKTANLVRSAAFSKPAICVDTHVHRITNRWGYVKTKTPHETENVLRKKLPLKHWREINTLLVAFGQNTCKPIRPHCGECSVRNYCNYYATAHLRNE